MAKYFRDILLFLPGIIGGIFALVQWVKSNTYKRAEFINSLVTTLRNDEEISSIIYMFDYDSEWYTREFHYQRNKLEHDVDKTLAYFYNLFHFSKKNNCEFSFKYLFDYCYKNKLFTKCIDIKSISNNFPRYLNLD